MSIRAFIKQREGRFMISMTTYWQMLHTDMSLLKNSDPYFQHYPPINAAIDMATLGLSFELPETYAYSMPGILNTILLRTKSIGPLVTLIAKGYTTPRPYPLPEITNHNNLLFAILYHKHLYHYQHHEYQGPINDIPFINALTKIKKTTDNRRSASIAQTDALGKTILAYCQTHNIPLTKENLIPDVTIKPADFIASLKAIINSTQQETLADEVQTVQLTAQKTNTEQAQALLLDAEATLKAFDDLLVARNMAEKTLLNFDRQYKRLPLATLALIKIMPIKSEGKILLSDRKAAQDTLTAIRTEINLQLGDNEADFMHRACLQNMFEQAGKNYATCVDEERSLAASIKKALETESVEKTPHLPAPLLMLTFPSRSPTPSHSIATNNFYFFNGLSKKQIAGAVIAAGVAVAFESLNLTL